MKHKHRLKQIENMVCSIHTALSVLCGAVGLLIERTGIIMATQAELTAQVKAATDKLNKIGTETATLLTKISELTTIIANGPVSTELQQAVDALAAQAQIVDDLVPDATVS